MNHGTKRTATTAGCLAAIALGGCGAASDYANGPRPPRPLNVAAAITDGRVLISPTRVGGGPIVLVVTNQSPRSQDLTISPAEGADPCTSGPASTGPINPQGTASVTVTVTEGACEIGTRGGSVRPARLDVGGQRRSSQNDLLLP